MGISPSVQWTAMRGKSVLRRKPWPAAVEGAARGSVVPEWQ